MAKVKMPESNSKISFTINNFSGGLVNNVNDAKMLDGESPDMLNMIFRNDGLIQKRPGSILLGNFRYECDNVFVVEPEPNVYKYIYTSGNKMYYNDEFDNPYFIKNIENPILDGCQFMNKFFFVDGRHIYYFDLKTKFVYIVEQPPLGFVPNPKPAIYGEVKTALINGHFFRTWYEPCQYEMEDGYKGGCSLPTSPSAIVCHNDRLYVSGGKDAPNMVYISDVLVPEYFPSALPLQTPPNDDIITSLDVFNDCLIIGRRDSIYVVFGNTNREDSIHQYTMNKVNSHTGIANNNCSDLIHNLMFFVGSDGNMYKLAPPSTDLNTLKTTQLNVRLDLTKAPFNLPIQDIRYAHTLFDSTNNLWYIQINEHTIVYNYTLRAFTRYNNINAVKYVKLDNELQFIRQNGSIYKFAKAEDAEKYYDDYYDVISNQNLRLPVYSYWTSRTMDFNNPALVKQFREMYVTSETFDDHDTTVNVKFEVDYIDINKEFVIENEIARWDSAIWGKSKYTSRNIDRSLPIVLNRRGRSLKLSYGNGYNFYGSFYDFPKPSDVPEYSLIYSIPEGMMYLRVPHRYGYETNKDKYFREFTLSELNQALLVHNITGLYQAKGYR